MNEFSIKEKVMVNGVIGEVKQIKRTTMFYENGKEHSTYEYLVGYGDEGHKQWYLESRLKNYLNDEISVNEVLINANLLHNLDLAKQLSHENDELKAAKVKKD
ncbi:hypothetical protein D3C84_887600 [compost metagenome]